MVGGLGCLRRGFVAWSLEYGTTYAHLRIECVHQCLAFGFKSCSANPSGTSTLVSPQALMWGGVGVLVETDRQRRCISTTCAHVFARSVRSTGHAHHAQHVILDYATCVSWILVPDSVMDLQ